MKTDFQKQASQNTGGINFLGLLTICFIVLKLCNVINWSWFWVLSPTVIPIIIVLIILIIMFGVGIYKVYNKK